MLYSVAADREVRTGATLGGQIVVSGLQTGEAAAFQAGWAAVAEAGARAACGIQLYIRGPFGIGEIDGDLPIAGVQPLEGKLRRAEGDRAGFSQAMHTFDLSFLKACRRLEVDDTRCQRGAFGVALIQEERGTVGQGGGKGGLGYGGICVVVDRGNSRRPL